MATASPTQRRPPADPAKRKKLILVLVIGLVLVSFGTFIAVSLFGLVGGQEFSPTTFERRQFYYYQLPVLNLQVTGIERSDESNTVEQHLKSKGLIKFGDQKQAKRWDLVYSSHGAEQVAADAKILTTYLDCVNYANGEHWLDWTKDNPKLAAELWPVVARAAYDQMYYLTPQLFELSQSFETPGELERELHKYLATNYAEVIEARQELGDDAGASRLAKSGVQLILADEATLEKMAKIAEKQGE